MRSSSGIRSLPELNHPALGACEALWAVVCPWRPEKSQLVWLTRKAATVSSTYSMLYRGWPRVGSSSFAWIRHESSGYGSDRQKSMGVAWLRLVIGFVVS